jgi:hypothetical protein
VADDFLHFEHVEAKVLVSQVKSAVLMGRSHEDRCYFYIGG